MFGVKFKDINLNYIDEDFHIHSNYTDGKNTIFEIVNQAEKLNLNKIAITDHIRESSIYFDKFSLEINEIRERTKLKILIGYEARIKDFKGNIDVSASVFNKADIRIGSVHRVGFGDKLFSINEFNKNIAFEIERELTIEAIINKNIDIIGHAGGMCITNFGGFPIQYFEDIISACKNNGIAFEINSRYHSNIFTVLYPILVKYNPFVTFGSDAHSLEEIAKYDGFIL